MQGELKEKTRFEKGQKLYRFKLDLTRGTFERHQFEITDVNRRGWVRTVCPSNSTLKFMMGFYFDPDVELGTVKTWQSCKYVMLREDDPATALEILARYFQNQLEDQRIVMDRIQSQCDLVRSWNTTIATTRTIVAQERRDGRDS